jgi:hypothetical protein
LLFLEIYNNVNLGKFRRELRDTHNNEEMKVLRYPLKAHLYTSEFENKILDLIYLTVDRVVLRPKHYTYILKPPNFKSELKCYQRQQLIPEIRYVCSENVADFYFSTLYNHINKDIIPSTIMIPETFLEQKGNPYFELFEENEVIYDVDKVNTYPMINIIIIFVIIGIIFLIIYLRMIYKFKIGKI